MKHEHATAAAAGAATGASAVAAAGAAAAGAAPRAARRVAHRAAVIGHGPAAIETSDLLICMGDYFVDLFSPTPAPTCLIRFGSTYRAGGAASGGATAGAVSGAVRDNLVPRLRLFGNVQVGSSAGTVSVGDLTHYYDTVIVASDSTSAPDPAPFAGGGLVVVGNSREASATHQFLRAHTALPISRTPVVTDPAAAAAADRPGAIVTLLESRSIPFTTWTGWHRPAWAGAAADLGADSGSNPGTDSGVNRGSETGADPETGGSARSVVTARQWFSLVAVARAVPDTP